MMTDEQLSALLRLKRHEMPPPGYFDRLLQDVHRRQRQELLRQPLWRIALERWQTFFSEHSMGPMSYAGAMASVVLIGSLSVALLTTGTGPGGVAPSGAVAQVKETAVKTAPARLPLESWSARGGRVAEALPPPQFQVATQRSPGHDVRRYVIDARPVSYEPGFSF